MFVISLFFAALLVSMEINSQNVLFQLYNGTCANSHFLAQNLLPIHAGECFAIASIPYAIPSQHVLTSFFIQECGTLGVIRYYKDEKCTRQVYASGDATCMEATDPGDHPPVFRFSCPSFSCSPIPKSDLQSCRRMIRQCDESGTPMRWTGKGCRRQGGGGVMNDAGCQCRDYCGFTCKSACIRGLNKKYCEWSNGKCKNKQTGDTGDSSAICPEASSI